MDPINILFQIFSLGIVTLWAARLAKGRGRSQYLWGGGALILSVGPMLIPGFGSLQILGILPVVALMIMQPVSRTQPMQASNRFCPYCGSAQTPTYNTIEQEKTSIQWTCSGCNSSVTEYLAPSASQTNVPLETPQNLDMVDTDLPPIDELSSVEVAIQTEPSQTEPDHQVKDFSPRPISPETFTARGKDLMDNNKPTEAIDQFTKALALDYGYIQALKYRIHAYKMLGLTDLAKKDQTLLTSL